MHGMWLVVGYFYTIDARKPFGWAPPNPAPCTLPSERTSPRKSASVKTLTPVNAKANGVRLKSTFVSFRRAPGYCMTGSLRKERRGTSYIACTGPAVSI